METGDLTAAIITYSIISIVFGISTVYVCDRAELWTRSKQDLLINIVVFLLWPIIWVGAITYFIGWIVYALSKLWIDMPDTPEKVKE